MFEFFYLNTPAYSRICRFGINLDCNLHQTNLQWKVWVQLKFRHHLGPGLKLLGLCINVVIKHSPCGGELDCLKLSGPPFGKLHSIIHQLEVKSLGD